MSSDTPRPYQPAPGYNPQVPVGMSPQDERTWAMLAHLSPFVASLVGLPFLGPLIVFLIYKDRSRFVRDQSLESLNFQLTLLIGIVLGVLLSFVLIGIPLLIALGLAAIVLQVIAAVAANRGEPYRYPLTIRFVK